MGFNKATNQACMHEEQTAPLISKQLQQLKQSVCGEHKED